MNYDNTAMRIAYCMNNNTFINPPGGMLSNFTDRARKVLSLARRNSEQLGHQYIGTEHLLLGMIDEGSGVAHHVLAKLGVDKSQVREAIIAIINPPKPMSEADIRRETWEKAIRAVEAGRHAYDPNATAADAIDAIKRDYLRHLRDAMKADTIPGESQ